MTWLLSSSSAHSPTCKHVWPVCLPKFDFAVDIKCYVTGWGHKQEGGDITQVTGAEFEIRIPLKDYYTFQLLLVLRMGGGGGGGGGGVINKLTIIRRGGVKYRDLSVSSETLGNQLGKSRYHTLTMINYCFLVHIIVF